MQAHAVTTTTSATEVGLISRTLLFVRDDVRMRGVLLALVFGLPLTALGLGVFMAGEVRENQGSAVIR